MKRPVMIMALGLGLVPPSPCFARGLDLVEGIQLAHGFVEGAAAGIAEHGAVAGPIGVVLGGAVGAATGMIRSILCPTEEPRRRARFPSDRSAFHRAPGADERILLVDPRSGSIVDIID